MKGAVVALSTLLAVAGIPLVANADLIAYWNFNDLDVPGTGLGQAPGEGNVPITIDADLGSGTLSLANWGGLVQNFAGSTINAQDGAPAGVSLSLQGGDDLGDDVFAGNGTFIEIQFSMTGLSDLGVSFATRGTSTGFDIGQWSYSTDGIDFTDFGPNTATRSTSFSLVGPFVTSALDDAANAFLRYTLDGAESSAGNNRIDNLLLEFNAVEPPPPPPPPGPPRLPQPGDVVFGLDQSNPANTFELVRGPVSPNDGVASETPWQSVSFMQSVAFDNHDGILHNARGNLLAVSFGTNPNPTGDPPPEPGQGGVIYSFATRGSIPAQPGEPIGNTSNSTHNPDFPAVGHDGSLTPSRLGGISVSPDNAKIAVTGYDSGRVIVYDYTPGDTFGSGAALSGGRESSTILAQGTTQGSVWVDSDTVLALSRFGDLYTVDATTTANSFVRTIGDGGLGLPTGGSGHFTSLAFNPDVTEDFVYATWSGFFSGDASPTQTRLFVLDANNAYDVLHEIDLSGVLSDTSREIALDADGNLFLSVRGSEIYVIEDIINNPTSTPISWYVSGNFSAFNGLDVGFGDAIDGDLNGDGFVDARDYVWWRKNNGTTEQYDAWRAAFGSTSGSGSALGNSAAVPEPSAAVLVLAGLVGFCLTRGRARR